MSIPNQKNVDLSGYHFFVCLFCFSIPPFQTRDGIEARICLAGVPHRDALLVQVWLFGHQHNAQKVSDIQSFVSKVLFPLCSCFFQHIHNSFLDNPRQSPEGLYSAAPALVHKSICLRGLHSTRGIFLVVKLAYSSEHFLHMQSSGFHSAHCI